MYEKPEGNSTTALRLERTWVPTNVILIGDAPRAGRIVGDSNIGRQNGPRANVGGLLPTSRLPFFLGVRHNKERGRTQMANLVIEMPDDLARSLEGIAAVRRKSVQQLALEQLSSLVAAIPNPRVGSPLTILQAMQAPPHLSSIDVDDLDAAIAAGRLPVRIRDLFSADPS
jgi:hypothetical protein